MRRFYNNTKGAVTVFISLLLIPAILISGTAVDLARLHSAQSILQDANQLAANAVLTQYNALLCDLYGVFGVAKDDPILGSLLDEYIRVAVFGEPAQDRTLGTLQIFYGADLMLEEPHFISGAVLSDEEVLRRQIMEYMKFRGPVIIVKEILEVLENTNIKADKQIIDSKTAIDADVAAIFDKYKELYEAITAADKCTWAVGGIGGGHFGTVSSHLQWIRAQFVDLRACYTAWESLTYPDAPDDPEAAAEAAAAQADFERMKADYAMKYYAILENIRALTIGGRRGSDWSDGGWERLSAGATALNFHIESAKQNGENFKTKFDTVVDLSRELDEMNEELSRKIDELENKLNSGECSEELRTGFTEKYGTPTMSLIERYREILQWNDITSMSSVYSEGGYDYIDNKYKPMLDDVEYRNKYNPSAASLTRTELANLSSDPSFRLTDSIAASSSRAAYFASFSEDSVTYGMPPGFKKFAEYPGENKAFFEALEAMQKQPKHDPIILYDGQEKASGSNSEERQRKMINSLLELVDTAYKSLKNEPLGAKYISGSKVSSPVSSGIISIISLIPQALDDPIIKIVEDLQGSIKRTGEHALLLTYCMSMFSHYTTIKPESLGKTIDDLVESDFTKSLSGVPISPKVNYFFQSEWEYLYNGSLNAGDNLNAITRLMFLVRLVCNYITVFSVNEVTMVITSIQAAFSWCPPLGILLGELTRAAFVAAESVIDIAALRSGKKVPVVKKVSAGEWLCSPSGVLSAVKGVISSEAVDDEAFKNEKGLLYSQYMLVFFFSKALFSAAVGGGGETELAVRTGNLIEWNMINYQNNVNANEAKMSEALLKPDRFMLSNMVTGFRLTTSANMRMLFLSMPIAQRGLRAVIPPETLPVSATDYRGY